MLLILYVKVLKRLDYIKITLSGVYLCCSYWIDLASHSFGAYGTTLGLCILVVTRQWHQVAKLRRSWDQILFLGHSFRVKYIWQTWLFRFKLVSDLDLYSKWKLNLHFKTVYSLEFNTAEITLQNECILRGKYTSKHCVPWSSDELEDITRQSRCIL